MRLAAINRIQEKRVKPYTNYNPKACEYIDNLNRKKGWNLRHALNGGEIQICGYFLDGYDKERNIVLEYDEPRHDRPSRIKRDVIRQNNIIECLDCKFYRYKESDKKMIRVN